MLYGHLKHTGSGIGEMGLKLWPSLQDIRQGRAHNGTGLEAEHAPGGWIDIDHQAVPVHDQGAFLQVFEHSGPGSRDEVEHLVAQQGAPHGCAGERKRYRCQTYMAHEMDAQRVDDVQERGCHGGQEHGSQWMRPSLPGTDHHKGLDHNGSHAEHDGIGLLEAGHDAILQIQMIKGAFLVHGRCLPIETVQRIGPICPHQNQGGHPQQGQPRRPQPPGLPGILKQEHNPQRRHQGGQGGQKMVLDRAQGQVVREQACGIDDGEGGHHRQQGGQGQGATGGAMPPGPQAETKRHDHRGEQGG